jgi:hypothetical protein
MPIPIFGFAPGVAIIWDDWGNVYVSGTASTSPGINAYSGHVKHSTEDGVVDVEALAVDQQEMVVEQFLSGYGISGCAAKGVGGCIAWSFGKTAAVEVGVSTPGYGLNVSRTFLIIDRGRTHR